MPLYILASDDSDCSEYLGNRFTIYDNDPFHSLSLQPAGRGGILFENIYGCIYQNTKYFERACRFHTKEHALLMYSGVKQIREIAKIRYSGFYKKTCDLYPFLYTPELSRSQLSPSGINKSRIDYDETGFATQKNFDELARIYFLYGKSYFKALYALLKEGHDIFEFPYVVSRSCKQDQIAKTPDSVSKHKMTFYKFEEDWVMAKVSLGKDAKKHHKFRDVA